MRREYLDLDDDGCEVKDGESVRVPVFLTDTVRFADGEPHFARAVADADLDLADHRPGFRYATDAARAAVRDARDQMVRRAENAWRTLDARRKKPNNGDDDPDNGDDEVMGAEGAQKTDPDKIGQSSLDARSIADRKRRARDAYVRRLCDAWKRPMDAAEPTNSSSPEEWNAHRRDVEPDHDAGRVLRGHLQTERNEENQRRRDTAWEEMRRRLSTRWQSGQTNARAATEIEQQREKWLGK